MNNEEIKTNAEFLDEAMVGETTPIEVDDTIELYTPEDEEPETPDVSSDDEDVEDKIYIDLPSGVQLSMNYSDMDWKKIWENNVEDMSNNILAIMAMGRDMRLERVTEKRTELAQNIIDVVKRSFSEIGVPEIDMSKMWFETKVEEATLYLEDYLRLISEIVHIAQIDIITKPVEGMSVNQLIENLSEQMANFQFPNNNKTKTEESKAE
jgi:hypothetical protein